MDWKVGAAALLSLAGLAACASVVGSTQSSVRIQTNPAQARCVLAGHDFSATIETPAEVVVPHAAAPVSVSCVAPGFRTTTYTLDVKGDGWIWGNSAFMLATGGIAILGALVDETRGAGRNFAEDVQYDLQPEQARAVRARSRAGDVDLRLQAR